MPMPAVPAPKTTIRCSSIGTPERLMPASAAETTTAAVPWMSSLKVHISAR